MAMASPAVGGSVEEALLQGSVTMNVSNGEVKGCTYRIVSLALSGADPSAGLMALDTSFGLHGAGFGMVKGGALRSEKVAGKPVRTQVARIESFWIKAPGAPATKPINGKVLQSDSPVGYVMYGIDLAVLNSLIDAAVDGKPLLVGVRLKGGQLDIIHSGVLQLSPHDQKQAANCFEELTTNILRESKPADAPAEPAPTR
jgi:hypothetical protein